MSASVNESSVQLLAHKWIEEEIHKHFQKVNTIVQKCVICPFNSTEGGLASKMYEVRLVTSSNSDFEVMETKNLALIVKLLPNEKAMDNMNISDQFHNEGLFFTEILPLLLKNLHDGDASKDLKNISTMFPKCVLYHEDSFQCMVAMENLSPLGFKLADKTLDLKHILLSLKALASFHALSYAWKKKDTKGFYKSISKVKMPRENGAFRMMFSAILNQSASYPIDLYKERYPEDYDRHLVRIKKVRESFTDASETFFNLFKPEEPAAVLCHGDYNRNNILFRYDKNGDPCDIKIIDFQLLSYSCPSIDIALILFLNTTYSIRKQHWNDFFVTYHDTLLETLAHNLDCGKDELLREYSIESIEKDFSKKALAGYFIVAFFLPIAFMKPESYLETTNTLSEVEDSLNPKIMERRLEEMRKYVGEVEKERLADLFREFLEKKYV